MKNEKNSECCNLISPSPNIQQQPSTQNIQLNQNPSLVTLPKVNVAKNKESFSKKEHILQK